MAVVKCEYIIALATIVMQHGFPVDFLRIYEKCWTKNGSADIACVEACCELQWASAGDHRLRHGLESPATVIVPRAKVSNECVP